MATEHVFTVEVVHDKRPLGCVSVAYLKTRNLTDHLIIPHATYSSIMLLLE